MNEICKYLCLKLFKTKKNITNKKEQIQILIFIWGSVFLSFYVPDKAEFYLRALILKIIFLLRYKINKLVDLWIIIGSSCYGLQRQKWIDTDCIAKVTIIIFIFLEFCLEIVLTAFSCSSSCV